MTNEDLDLAVALVPGTSDPEFAAKVRASIEAAQAPVVVIDGTQEPFTQTATRVEQSYDRHTRSWITTLVDENGYQIGDAAYDGDRAGAAMSKAQFERRIGETI